MNTWLLIRALLYLQGRSLVNAFKVRARRLKQPKYLIGAVVGLGYMYLWFGRALFHTASRPRISAEVTAIPNTLLEGGAALVILVIVAAQWIFTGSRAALQFTETELAFLLPAPVSRKMLIRYKLLRGQLGTLLSAFLLTMFTGRFAADARGIYHVLGWWLVLTLLNLHSIGASFTVQRLTERGMASWVRRLMAFAIFVTFIGILALWVRALPALPAFADDPRAAAGNLAGWFELALTTGPGPWLLLPFRWVVQPWFAASLGQFLQALVPMVLLLGLHYWWVERSDVAFEEASLIQSENTARRISAMQAGKRAGLPTPKKRLPSPFTLAPTGLPAIGLMWKNLIASRATPRKLAIGIAFVVVVAVGVRLPPIPSELRFAVWIASVAAFGVMALVGGSFTSSALRRDLGILDVLKGYPLPGWHLVLGELLGPALFISLVQALMALTAVLILPPADEDQLYTVPLALATAVAALIVVLPLNFVNALIPSAATLWFPAWAKPGRDIEQPGFEALGQRLVFGIAQIVLTLVSLVPAAALAFGIFFLVRWLAGPALGILLAGPAAAAVLTLEAWLGVRILGRLFDQYDASAEQ